MGEKGTELFLRHQITGRLLHCPDCGSSISIKLGCLCGLIKGSDFYEELKGKRSDDLSIGNKMIDEIFSEATRQTRKGFGSECQWTNETVIDLINNIRATKRERDYEIDRERLQGIEERLDAIEEVRPGRWFTALGSGNNVCTSISAELIVGPYFDNDGNEVATPEVCPYKGEETWQCEAPPPLRSTYCQIEKFPRDCPLEPTRVDTAFVLDCLPDWILKDYPSTPEHGPLLKFFETIKLDVRFLIDTVKRLSP